MRVSTAGQDEALQVDALEAAGVVRLWIDHASGSIAERPELIKLLDYARPGDTLVVWRLDRLGRSSRHLVDVIQDLDQRRVGFRSLNESIDTTSPSGKLIFHVFAALAEFERDLIRERTAAGLEAARVRARAGGRPAKMTLAKLEVARSMYASGDHTVDQIAETVGVSRSTIYRHLEPKE